MMNVGRALRTGLRGHALSLAQLSKQGTVAVRVAGFSHCTPSLAKSVKTPPGLEPTNKSRTSAKASVGQHPGYTDASTPVSDAHPQQMPGPKAGTIPASQSRPASTVSAPQHPGVREMAKGADVGGADAVKPEERNVKGWASNARSSQFNQHEGRRNPVLHGGSHEGGHDSKGKSKT